MTQPAAAPCGVSSPLKRPLQIIRAVHIHWRPVGLSPGLNELQIPGFTGPMRLTRLGRLIRLVVPRGPSPSPTSPEKWWCKWWCICRVPSPRSQCWQAFLKAVQMIPSPFSVVSFPNRLQGRLGTRWRTWPQRSRIRRKPDQPGPDSGIRHPARPMVGATATPRLQPFEAGSPHDPLGCVSDGSAWSLLGAGAAAGGGRSGCRPAFQGPAQPGSTSASASGC